MYRRAHLIDKPTVFGWHTWSLAVPDLAVCRHCHAVVPQVALDDGSWRWRAGGRCREFLRAIGAG